MADRETSGKSEGRDGSAVWLLFIFIIGFAHAAVYALTNPVFEAPDEPDHLGYVNFVAENRRLPNQLKEDEWAPQGHHHPLFYVAAASWVTLTQPDSRIDIPVRPFPYTDGDGGFLPDYPRYVHNGWHKDIPDTQDRTGFYGLRLINALFAALTALQCARLCRLFVPGQFWVIGGIFVALLPQFAFIGGSIGNDPLASFLATTALISMSRLTLESMSWRNFILAGLMVGLAILAKKSAICLLPVLLVASCMAVRNKSESAALGRLAGGMIALAMVVLCTGWFFVRNQVIYGELLGTAMEARTLPHYVHSKDIGDAYFVTEFPNQLSRSFFGHLGWMNVTVSPKALVVIQGLAGLGAIVGLAGLWPGLKKPPIWLSLVLVLSCLAGLIFYNLTYSQPQGRLMFPAIGGFAALVSLGYALLFGKAPQRARAMLGGLALVACVGVASAVVVLNMRFYSRPGIYTDVPPGFEPVQPPAPE